ncbi:hypothetical protein LTR84_008558 [Exophiala bonariae]|uniref:Major facilitator superfamily (MFS) profile domain-containing protein n=1 Tax=Exophiala bonariae TaxID=1690606 RepID=A0AAV9MXB8_9EURO|nr:hypothetical protein LTR84_008558 [Exophiala bonariae]
MPAPDHVENNMQDSSPVVEQKITKVMICFAIFIFLSGWIANFDLGYGGTVLFMEPFNRAFGKCHEHPDPQSGDMVNVCQLTALQQSLTSLTSLFTAVGGVLSGLLCSYLGRRVSLQLGSLIVATAAAGMLGTSGSYLNYMVCKSINGLGLGILYATTIVYGVECIVPRKRGLLLSLFTVGLASGNAGAAAVCAGSANLKDDWAWKTPIICQIPLSLLLSGGVLLFPESPRWLLLKAKKVKARQALGQFYEQDPNSEVITAQIIEIEAYLDFEKATSSSSSWTQLFNKRNIRRTLTSALILVGTILTGLQFVAPYTALFLGGLGISSPFLITAVIALCFTAGSLIGGLSIEYGGRRWAMLVGYSILGSCMLIFSAVSTILGATSSVAQKVLVACLCIWGFSFSGFIAPSGWVGSTEMHSIRLRDYGQAFTVNVNQIFGFGATFWTPYMISKDYGNMGTNVGYFYFALTVVVLVLVFFFVPETARLKLEQIDDYFDSGVPPRKTSMKRNVELAKSNVLEVGATTSEVERAASTRKMADG